MKLSVVIPTFNRSRELLMTLSAFANQTLSRDEFEVIAVDDGSDDDHRDRLKRYQVPFKLRTVLKDNGGLASARNAGAAAASGEFILFLDDDVIPDRDALDQHLQSHAAHDDAIAVVGSLPYPRDFEMTPFSWYLATRGHFDLYEKAKTKYPDGVPPLPPLNGNSSISKTQFIEAGKYDESFRHYGGEDLELGYRLAKAGVRFVYNAKAIGYHNHRKDFEQFCVDMESAGNALVQIYRQYPEIKVLKKIDVITDPFTSLSFTRKAEKMVASISLQFPLILSVPRLLVGIGQARYTLRYLLYPMYDWISKYYYALGIKNGLAAPL